MIYRCEVELTLFVEADSEAAAIALAEQCAGTEASENGVDFVAARPVTDAATVPMEWRESRPYGGNGSATVRDIVERAR